jgi:hypothetical protein
MSGSETDQYLATPAHLSVAEFLDLGEKYIPSKGLVVDEPKNETSARPQKLSKTAFTLLRGHGEWQGDQKEACGSHWKDCDGRVFTHEDGRLIALGWFTEFAEGSGYPGRGRAQTQESGVAAAQKTKRKAPMRRGAFPLPLHCLPRRGKLSTTRHKQDTKGVSR